MFVRIRSMSITHLHVDFFPLLSALKIPHIPMHFTATDLELRLVQHGWQDQKKMFILRLAPYSEHGLSERANNSFVPGVVVRKRNIDQDDRDGNRER